MTRVHRMYIILREHDDPIPFNGVVHYTVVGTIDAPNGTMAIARHFREAGHEVLATFVAIPESSWNRGTASVERKVSVSTEAGGKGLPIDSQGKIL